MTEERVQLIAQKTVLVFSPHADDAEIGVGGYIAKTVAEGGTVIVVLATVGSIKFLHLNRTVEPDERLEEFHESMKVLGVQHTHVLTRGYDSLLNTVSMGQMVAELDHLQDQYQPDEVLIPLPSAHQDHQYCWDVGVAATRPSPAKHSPTVIAAYEYPLTFWGSGSQASSFRGGIYVDVTQYWDKKVDALKKYKSQMRDDLSLISLNGVSALAQLRGVEAGFQKAELLHALRILRR